MRMSALPMMVASPFPFAVSISIIILVCMVYGCYGVVSSCPPDFLRDPNTNCTECMHQGFDISTACTTCLGSGSLDCEGEQDCVMGNFTFSALFHSYQNPTHMCGECGNNGPTCCSGNFMGQPETCPLDSNCFLRPIYCTQPYGSSAPDVGFPAQPPILRDQGDNVTLPEDIIIQDRPGIVRWERVNPYTREFNMWMRQIQFYIILYTFIPPGGITPLVVDRFLINLELDIGMTERNTYYGSLNVSQFDLSFRVQCSENYYGPQCNCSEVDGLFTCNDDGNIVCDDDNRDPQTNCMSCLPGRNPNTECADCILPARDPSTNCTQCFPGRDIATNCSKCLLPGRDPDTDCADCILTGRNPATNCEGCLPGLDPSMNCSTQLLPGSASGLIGGVVGGSVGAVLLILLIVITIVIFSGVIRKKRRRRKSIVMTQNQVYGADEQETELTQNQVYEIFTADEHSAAGRMIHEPLLDDGDARYLQSC